MQKYKDMSEAQQAIVKTFMLVLVVIIALVLWDTASATGKNNTINNYYTTEVTEVYETDNTRITSGVSDEELAEAMSLAFSMNHPFDYNTLRWQGSITGAHYDDENAISFGIAKRFEKMDALWHVEAGQNGSNEAFVGGVVFRF
jgi:hypothetical protein